MSENKKKEAANWHRRWFCVCGEAEGRPTGRWKIPSICPSCGREREFVYRKVRWVWWATPWWRAKNFEEGWWEEMDEDGNVHTLLLPGKDKP